MITCCQIAMPVIGPPLGAALLGAPVLSVSPVELAGWLLLGGFVGLLACAGSEWAALRLRRTPSAARPECIATALDEAA